MYAVMFAIGSVVRKHVLDAHRIRFYIVIGGLAWVGLLPGVVGWATRRAHTSV